MNFIGSAIEMTGIERKAYEDELANRRKPRMFSSTTLIGSPNTPYTLDFCPWLHRNFDAIVEAINADAVHSFSTW